MDKEELTALAERVETAEEPSRELGEEVLLACGWSKGRVGYFMGPLYGWHSPDGKTYFQDDDFERGKWNPTRWLDAALTLVPEGWSEYSLMNANGYHEATLNNHEAMRTAWGISETTPALALVAAALRSQAQGEGGSNG